MDNHRCLVCNQWLESDITDYVREGSIVGKVYNCIYCHKYAVSNELYADKGQFLKGDKEEASIIRYKLAARSSGDLCFLTTENISVYKSGEVPKPAVQLENFILWLGRKMGNNPGSDIAMSTNDVIAYTGSINDESLRFIITEASSQGYVQAQNKSINGGILSCQIKLTIPGWGYYETLESGISDSKQVFMAMQYGDAELDDIVDNVFKPAIKLTGYDLKRLDDSNPAGLIDDRLRVEIRKSKFLIADLSHGNKGAYWEAGFAEGLEKQVIYTCDKDVFSDDKNKPHFDTNHHLTIVWDRGDLNKAVEELKACIRATFPEDAIMED